MKSGEGMLIAFATGPGQTALDGQEGANSPFTRALVANITAPGVEIQQAMTRVRAQVNEETNKSQLPWGHTNLIGSVYLNGAPAAAPAGTSAAPSAPAAVASAPGTDVELEFWRSIKDSNKPEELNAYVTNYPNGQFKSLALSRIASLESGPSTTTRNLTAGIDPATFTEEATQVTEDQIGLDKGQRRDVQRRLNGLGFDTKITGKFDESTRGVITRWQAARGYPKSGYLNRLQHKALLTEIVATTPSANSSDDEGRPARRRAAVVAAEAARRLAALTVVAIPRAPGASSAAWSAVCSANSPTLLRKAKPGIIPGLLFGGAKADLFASGFPQGFVDAVLPAGSALLKIFEHILVDAQRNQFFHPG
jgi:peptidoglycan hydrolase-like protein with peptidoglycan-binding domain